MKKILLASLLLLVSWSSFSNTPTEAVEQGVGEILKIAQAKELSAEQRLSQLEVVINNYVDLQAASQRVLAVHWKKASSEEKKEFVAVFGKVLTQTYFNLLEKYENEKVIFGKEEIKKEKFATVDSKIISGGKEIPVEYRLYFRNGKWKLYDLIPEGISMIRSFSSDYKGILRKEGVSGLSAQLKAKVDVKSE